MATRHKHKTRWIKELHICFLFLVFKTRNEISETRAAVTTLAIRTCQNERVASCEVFLCWNQFSIFLVVVHILFKHISRFCFKINSERFLTCSPLPAAINPLTQPNWTCDIKKPFCSNPFHIFSTSRSSFSSVSFHYPPSTETVLFHFRSPASGLWPLILKYTSAIPASLVIY